MGHTSDSLKTFLEGFKTFAELSNQGIGIGGISGGVFYMNPALLSIIGAASLSEMQAYGYMNLYQAKIQKQLENKIFPKLFKDGSWEGNLVLCRIDGEEIVTKNKMAILSDESGDPMAICNLVEDISHTVKLQEELELYQNHLEVLVEERTTHLNLALGALNAGVFKFETQTGDMIWDQRSFQLFQVDHKKFKLTFDAWSELVNDEDLPEVLNEFEDTLQAKGNHSLTLEYRLKDESNGLVYINASGYISRDKNGRSQWVYGLHTDISERKRQEYELLEQKSALEYQQSLMDALMDNVPDYVYFKDEKSRFLKVSDSMNKRHKLGGNSLIGKSDVDIHTDVNAKLRFKQEMDILNTGKPLVDHHEIEEVINGEKVWLSTTKMPLTNSNGKVLGTFGISKDITPFVKQKEELLKNSELNQCLIHLHEIEYTGEKDFITQALNRIQELSGSDIAYLHYYNEETKEIALGSWSSSTLENCKTVYDEHYPLEMAGIWGDAVRKRKPIIINDYPKLKTAKGLPDGHFPLLRHLGVPIFDGKQIMGIVGVGNKNSDYTQADVDQLQILTRNLSGLLLGIKNVIALKESEKKFRVIFENMNEGFALHEMIYDDNGKPFDYKFLDINPAFETMTGLSESVAKNKTIREIMPGIENDPADWIGQYGAVVKDGSTITLENYSEALKKWFRVHAFSPQEGKFAVTFSDITLNKEQEQEIQDTLVDLQRSNADLEQFAYVASHDLQEPLRKVKNYAELLERRFPEDLDDKAINYLRIINSGAGRMQHLIQDLLRFSRVSTQGKSFEKVDLNTVVDEVKSNLEVAIAESEAIIVVKDLPSVSADSSQIYQVFQNLVSNSLKFRGDKNPKITISAKKRKKEWEVLVKDNGIGMDMKYADRIFVVFQRLHTRTEYPGTGIGLALVKKIVERHGGTIWIDSKIGKGSSFTFTFPLEEKKIRKK